MPLTPEQRAIAQKKLRLLELERERAMVTEQEAAAPSATQPPSEGDVATAAAYDAIAKLGKGLDYLAGFGRTTAMEGLERSTSTGAKGIGAENWNRALKGEAKPFEDYFKEHGMTDKFYANRISGLVADTLTDPLGYVVAGKKAIGALKGLNPWSEVGKAMLVSDGANMLQAPFRLTKAANRVGKAVYRMPYGKVAQDMAKKVDSHRFGNLDAIDNMYNANVAGSAEDLKKAYNNSYEEAYDNYASATKGYKADLSPTVTADKMAHGDNLVKSYIDDMSKQLRNSDMLPDQAEKTIADLTAKAADPNDPFFTKMRRGGQDDFTRRLKARLREAIGGEVNERADALLELKERLHPEFHPAVDKLAKKLDGPGREAAMSEMDALVNTSFSGEKNLPDLDAIGADFRTKAAGSDAFGTNIYNAGGKKDVRKAMASKTGSNIKGIVEETMNEADRLKFQEGKAAFAPWARSKKAFLDVVDKSVGKHSVDALDALGGTMVVADLADGSAGNMTLGAALGLGAKRGLQNLRRFPQTSSRLGVGIKKAGQLNIWDNMAREGAVKGAKYLADDEAK